MFFYNSVLGMDMSEKMGFEIMDRWKPFKDFFRAIIDAVIEIKYSVCRRMCNKNVGILRNTCKVAALAVGDAIAHEHRDSIEFQSVDLDAGVAEIMHIVVKTVDIGSIQAIIVVAADEYLVAIWQIAEPVEKVNRFLLATYHAEIAGMNHYISLGQIPQPPVASMSIRKMQYFHSLFVCKNSKLVSQNMIQ